MIQYNGLRLNYWAEAIICENYIVNHTPIEDLKNITSEEAWNKTKPYVSDFCVFGSVAWAHISDEKMKDLQPKSEKSHFVGYFEDVKGYILLQPHFDEIVIRRGVKFDKNILTCEPPLIFVPFIVPILVSSSLDDVNDDENPYPHAHLPMDDSIEHEPRPTWQLPIWVHSTQEVVGDLVGDPSDQRRTC